MSSHQVLTLRDERVQKLVTEMRELFGVPETARWFEVRFAVNELVTVRCEYVPAEKSPCAPAP